MQSMGAHIIPEYLSMYKLKYPDVTFNVTVSKAIRIRELVAKKKLDIGIIGSHDPERNDARLVEETIDKDEMVLAIPNSHPLAGREKISIWKLKNLELIVSFRSGYAGPSPAS